MADIINDAVKLADSRVALCRNQPACSQCGTHQVQIINVGTQEWKCRHCHKTFFTNYEVN